MAQAISLQRGSVTFTARGDNTTANITSLFTNAPGNGTRVIINYLTVQNPYVSGASSYVGAKCSGFLGVVSSGTTGSIIGGMIGGASQMSTYSMPISDPGTAASGGSSTVFSSPRMYAQVANLNQVGFTGTYPNNITTEVNDTTIRGSCPRSFWIGSQDVVKWWPRTSSYETTSGKTVTTNYYTQTLYYSFTCITES